MIKYKVHFRTTLKLSTTVEAPADCNPSVIEDAVRKGIKRFSKTVDNVESAWVKEQKVRIKDGDIAEYRVTMIVTFILKD